MSGSTGTTVETFDRRLLPPMMLGAILNPINSSIIAVALVPIGAALGEPASRTAWLVSGLYIATALGQPLMGRLVDQYGPRRVFLAGALFTGAAGLVGTLAPNLWVLVVARVLLGFGTCAGYPTAMYLIRSEAHRTGTDSPTGVLTVLSVTTQTVAVIGPAVGGLLIALGGWRATFAINLLLAGGCLVLGTLFVPAHARVDDGGDGDGDEDGDGPQRDRRFDLVGVATFGATLVTLMLFLMEPRADRVWLLAVTLVAGGGFTWWELRRSTPFLDVRVLGGNAPLVATYARSLVAAVVSYSYLYGYTQWLEDGRGLSASEAGLALIPAFAVGIVVAAVSGRRPEVRGKLLVGATAQLAASLLLLTFTDEAPVWLLLAVAVVFGLPQGLVNLANQNALYHQARPDKIGASAGLLRTFFYLGALVASAAAGVSFGRTASSDGLHHLAMFMVVAAALFLLITAPDRSLARCGSPSEGLRRE